MGRETTPRTMRPVVVRNFSGNLAIVKAPVSYCIHAKLSVGQPDDEDEIEVDRVADAIVAGKRSTAISRSATSAHADAKIREKAARSGYATGTERGFSRTIARHGAVR